VMLLMMGEVLQFSRIAQAFPGNWFWRILAFNQTHSEWAGCSLHDLIQPGFSFLVGVALPYSIASRLAKGATFGRMFGHTLWRALLLIALGIFCAPCKVRRPTLRSKIRSPRSDWAIRFCSCSGSVLRAGNGLRSP